MRRHDQRSRNASNYPDVPIGSRDYRSRLRGSRARVEIAGIFVIRREPAFAEGVLSLTTEDETGIANGIIWPDRFEAQRRTVISAAMIGISGRVQREGEVIDGRTATLPTLLVDEHQRVRIEIEPALEPSLVPVQDVGTILLGRMPGLSSVIRRRLKKRHKPAMLTPIPRPASSSRRSADVMSDFLSSAARMAAACASRSGLAID